MNIADITRAMTNLPAAKRHTSPLRSPSQRASYVDRSRINTTLTEMMDIYETAAVPGRTTYTSAAINTINPLYVRLSGGILNAARTRTR